MLSKLHIFDHLIVNDTSKLKLCLLKRFYSNFRSSKKYPIGQRIKEYKLNEIVYSKHGNNGLVFHLLGIFFCSSSIHNTELNVYFIIFKNIINKL